MPWLTSALEEGPICAPIAWCRASPTPTTSRSSPARRPRCTASPAISSTTARRRCRSDDERSEISARRHDPRDVARAGAKLAVVTAKDKLRKLLGHKMTRHLLLVRESRWRRPGRARHRQRAGLRRAAAAVGLQRRTLSEFVFAAGVKLMEADAAGHQRTCRPPITCSTSMRRARGDANAFYAMIDGYLAQLDKDGPHHRAYRRSRHERQVWGRQQAQGHLPAGRARRLDGQGAPRVLPITDPIRCITARRAPTRYGLLRRPRCRGAAERIAHRCRGIRRR